jgi:hypothetical protein
MKAGQMAWKPIKTLHSDTLSTVFSVLALFMEKLSFLSLHNDVFIPTAN